MSTMSSIKGSRVNGYKRIDRDGPKGDYVYTEESFGRDMVGMVDATSNDKDLQQNLSLTEPRRKTQDQIDVVFDQFITCAIPTPTGGWIDPMTPPVLRDYLERTAGKTFEQVVHKRDK